MTRRLAIDFCPRRRAGLWIGGSILVAGLIATVASVEHYQALGQQRDTLEASLREPAKGRSGVRDTGPAAGSDEAQRRGNSRRAVVRGLGRPWDVLFADIEASVHDQVALLTLEPDVRRGEVRLSGEARDAKALSEYIAALERTSALERVNLAQHEMVAEDGQSALRFVLVGGWQGVRR